MTKLFFSITAIAVILDYGIFANNGNCTVDDYYNYGLDDSYYNHELSNANQEIINISIENNGELISPGNITSEQGNIGSEEETENA